MDRDPSSLPRQRLCLTLGGTTQGVGFRPFVYRLATALGLGGWVRNSGQGVQLEVEGESSLPHEFFRRLQSDKPPAAANDRCQDDWLEPLGYNDFSIRSSHSGLKTAAISPDLATCSECLQDVRDPDISAAPASPSCKGSLTISIAPPCLAFKCVLPAKQNIAIRAIVPSIPKLWLI